jgi:hypothetical protein
MKFTYSSGARPLDGYTIKRGVGRGGFGEVYYGVSDGGKEVALKLVRGNLEVELRGVAQCLNLKHPNLVNLYDLKTDAQGNQWVVMEYVAGEALNTVLSRHPNGLAPELAQQWFLALAQAVGYLHDHGIVHRDLKPGNIFLENGVIKVGDYGLSKFISGSQRTAQTQSVGTVHYMAPEISTGNYGKQIDVYAAGIILYEMLTGHVPFEGESAGEILMKHLTTPPDLSRLPSAYVPIVGKALAKNPAHRYASMAEMARAVERVGDEREARKPDPPRPEFRPPRPLPRPEKEPILTVLPVISWRQQLVELCGSMALTAVFALVATLLWVALKQTKSVTEAGTIFFPTVIACWAVLVPAKFWTAHRGDSWFRRIVMMALGAGVGFAALWLDGWTPNFSAPEGFRGGPLSELAGHMAYFALAFFAVRWWKMADRRRSHRFSFGPMLATAFWALLLLLIWHQMGKGTVVLIMASAIVQLVSPWDQPPPATCRKMRLRYA